jgi:hypothetical protein
MYGHRGFYIAVLSSATLKAYVAWVGSLFTIDARTYRPEKYYMRGPGPKWHEKHASLFDGL